MKIGIFLEKFTNTEIDKDPGIIASRLLKEGIDLKVFSCSPSLEVTQKFSVIKINKNYYESISYWKKSGIETLIIYSWLSIRYTKMISSAKKAGLKVILKLDSDGFLIHPFKPSYIKVFGIDKSMRSKIKYIMRMCQWYLIPRFISKIKIRQIEMSDAVIIETPKAKENLVYSLSFWGKNILSEKIRIIPNPIVKQSTIIKNKNDLITCIGRWDALQKNPKGLIQVLSKTKTNWKINLIGNGSINLANKIKKNNPDILINAQEKITHDEIFLILSKTKIFFAPSIYESFNLAAAEALCCGCSVVGGPIPSFQYFINDNFSGSISDDFDSNSLKLVLEKDIEKWDNGKYNPEEIAKYWRQELSEEKVSKQIIELIKSL